MQSQVFGALITGTDGRCVGAESLRALEAASRGDVVVSSRRVERFAVRERRGVENVISQPAAYAGPAYSW